MTKLFILDYANSIVDIYDMEDSVEVNEELIEELGHNSTHCSWMYGDDIEMIYNREVIRDGKH